MLSSVALVSALLVACGGGGGDELDSTIITPPTGDNQAPTITGTPQGTVMQNAPYSFTPTANDPDGDTLTFSITGMPSWASFDANTGQLSGTPGAGDINTYTNVAITVAVR